MDVLDLHGRTESVENITRPTSQHHQRFERVAVLHTETKRG